MSRLLRNALRRIVVGPPPVFPYAEADAGYLAELRRAARRRLKGRWDRGDFLAYRRRRAGLHEPSAMSACLLTGLMTAKPFDASGEDERTIRGFMDGFVDPAGRLRWPPRVVHDGQMGYVMLEMTTHDSQGKWRVAADAIARFLIEEYPRSSTGKLPYVGHAPEVLLVDALGGVCPFLVRYGRTTGSSEAVDLAVGQLVEFLERGMDAHTGLSFHAYEATRGDRLGIVGWARGVGWLTVGLADTLAYLPSEHPHYRELQERFVRLVEVLGARQDDEGLWRWAIPLPGARVDTSGAAFIGYAIERGVASGVLDRASLAISERALQGLVRHTSMHGCIEHSQDDVIDVGLYPTAFGRTSWAQGAAVALTALVLTRRAARNNGGEATRE